MKKIIALSTLLALGALGMACGDAASNNTVTNGARNANTAMNNANTTISTTTNTQVNGATGATNTTTTTTNTTGSNMRPANMNANARP